MGLKKAENQVKILLAETILAMCRNTLNNHAEVSVEGLLGITLDNDEIFLVSINQTINNPDAPSKTRQLNSETSATNDVRDESSSRKRDKTNADGDSSSSDSDEESTRDSKSKRRRRKRKRRRSSKSSNESGSSSESEENDTRPSSPKRSNDNDFSQNPNSFTVMQQEDTSLSNLSETVQIKQERHDEEEEEEDLVIIKEEMSDLPTDNQFLNMQQQFDSSTFQPDFNSSFHQQSLSSDLSQPQPGPSSSNADWYAQQFCRRRNMAVPGIPMTRYRSNLSTQNDNQNDNREFCCQLCGKTFKAKNHLRYHMVTHTGSKDFACPVCGRGFGLKHSLRRHMASIHPHCNLISQQ